MDKAEDNVEQSILGIVEPPPHHSSGHSAGDHGREVDRLEQFLAVEFGVEHDGQQESKTCRDRDDRRDIDQRVECSLPEDFVREERAEVVQSYEGKTPPQQLYLVKAVE